MLGKDLGLKREKLGEDEGGRFAARKKLRGKRKAEKNRVKDENAGYTTFMLAWCGQPSSKSCSPDTLGVKDRDAEDGMDGTRAGDNLKDENGCS